VRELAGSIEAVEHVNEVLTMHLGPEYILVNISLDFRDHVPAGTVEKVVAALDRDIKASYVHVKRVFVEAKSKDARSGE
jgi:divalent metal cation (Fe/Co/Zn/Cd) transporter